jgi:hypothetical protein
MLLMFTAIGAELFQFQSLGRGSLVFRLAVVAVFAFTTLKLNNFAGHLLLFPSELSLNGTTTESR